MKIHCKLKEKSFFRNKHTRVCIARFALQETTTTTKKVIQTQERSYQIKTATVGKVKNTGKGKYVGKSKLTLFFKTIKAIFYTFQNIHKTKIMKKYA